MPTVSSSTMIEVRDLDFSYGETLALKGINLEIESHQVTALIGPSGCGKSTLLRCINRMNDQIPKAGITRGSIRIKGTDIHDLEVDPVELRRRVGMVFQKSNPFPGSIRSNVTYGPRVAGMSVDFEELLERTLVQVALWDEVKDRLDGHAHDLSEGQQQRLCIARTLALEPEIILMDEPCSALDPIASARVEELISQLKQDLTVVVVTHNMQQASRISDKTAFFYMGELEEFNDTNIIFTNPDKQRTEGYITGRFG